MYLGRDITTPTTLLPSCFTLQIMSHIKMTIVGVTVSKTMKKLKADRPHPRNYPWTPTDFRHTDNHLRLVMVFVARCCTRQSRAPKPFKQESSDKQTHGRTDGRTLPSTLSPCFAVDNYHAKFHHEKVAADWIIFATGLIPWMIFRWMSIQVICWNNIEKSQLQVTRCISM